MEIIMNRQFWITPTNSPFDLISMYILRSKDSDGWQELITTQHRAKQDIPKQHMNTLIDPHAHFKSEKAKAEEALSLLEKQIADIEKEATHKTFTLKLDVAATKKKIKALDEQIGK